MTLPFGIDISRYQYSEDGSRKPDFDKMNATCDFVAVRAGISWGYIDPWFKYSWEHISVPRLAYHVIYPGESGERQADHFLNIVKPGKHDRLVLDLELDHGYYKSKITDTVLETLEYIWDNVDFGYPVIYSRALWLNEHIHIDMLPKGLDYWLANYLRANPAPQFTPEMTPPPLMPNGVSTWFMHQTGEKGDGSKVGVVSHYVDTDRFNGTKEQLLAYFDYNEQPEPESEPVPGDVLFQGVVSTSPGWRLKTRVKPAGEVNPENLWYNSGDNVSVFEISDKWYQTSTALPRWADSSWINRLDTIPPATLLDIKPLWQNDPRWKDHKLGNSYYTIGQMGCLITALSGQFNTTPDQLNDALLKVGGFAGANLYWKAITTVMPNYEYVTAIDCYYVPAPLHEIDKMLEMKVPPVVQVDLYPGGVMNQHWVQIVGKSGSDYIINDPINGKQVSFRQTYGDPARWIFRIRAYRRQA